MRLCFHNDQVPYMHPMSSKTTFCRWTYRLLFKDLWHADKKQDRDALAKPLQSILQEVEGIPVVKTKVLHLFRSVQLSNLYSHATQLFLCLAIHHQRRQTTNTCCAETVELFCWPVVELAVSYSAFGVGLLAACPSPPCLMQNCQCM